MSVSLTRSPASQTFGLVIAVVVCFGAAGLGAAATTPRIPNWYAELAKPDWTPPAWVFGPVWTTLYLAMAVAVWLVWRARPTATIRLPLALFGVQLVLNSLWSVLFFGMQRPDLALVDIGALWAAIGATLLSFWPYSNAASLLLAPYLAWVSYAAVLNFSIWQLNR